MKINKNDKFVLNKVINTLTEMKEYKKDIISFVQTALQQKRASKKGTKIDERFVVFTDVYNTIDNALKHKTISAEHSNIVLQKFDLSRTGLFNNDDSYGFVFKKKTMIELYNIEQQSDHFICRSDIDIKNALLFVRNNHMFDSNRTFVENGIFVLPFSTNWYFNYFIDDQKWVFKDRGDYVTLADTKAIPTIYDYELISKLKELNDEKQIDNVLKEMNEYKKYKN